MVDLQLEPVGRSEQQANCRTLSHGRVYLVRVVVQATFLPKTENAAACFHLVDGAVGIELDFQDDLRWDDLAISGHVADLEHAFVDQRLEFSMNCIDPLAIFRGT